MARAAVKAKQQARAKAQPVKPARGRRGHAGGGDPNQYLFFTRLRRRQKWVFLGLAIVFAATFVGVGVGSGSGGLSDLYSGLFGGSGSDSVSKAQAEIKTNPAKGYKDLANAYIQKNDLANASSALQSYLKIKKKDAGEWSQLGGLQQQQANTYASQYQAAQAAAQAANPGGAFQISGALGTNLGSNPVNDYYNSTQSSQTQQLYQQAIGAYAQALSSYQTAAKLQPDSPNAQYLVYNAAVYAGKYPIALKALQRYVQLDPRTPNLKQIQKTCKQLGGTCAPGKPSQKSGTKTTK